MVKIIIVFNGHFGYVPQGKPILFLNVCVLSLTYLKK